MNPGNILGSEGTINLSTENISRAMRDSGIRTSDFLRGRHEERIACPQSGLTKEQRITTEKQVLLECWYRQAIQLSRNQC